MVKTIKIPPYEDDAKAFSSGSIYFGIPKKLGIKKGDRIRIRLEILQQKEVENK